MKPDSKIHLLVFGVGWPPKDTFIERRLRAVAVGKIEIIVVAQKPSKEYACLPIPRTRVVYTLNLHAPCDWFLGIYLLVLGLAVHPLRLVKFIKILVKQKKNIRIAVKKIFRLLPLMNLEPNLLHFEWPSSAIDHEWAFEFYNCPTVVSNRGRQINIWPHLPGKNEYNRALKRILEKTSLLHCVCNDILKSAVACGLAPEKGVIIYTAIDPAFYCPGENFSKEKRVLQLVMIGGLIWRKGYEYALMALAMLNQNGVEFELSLIGDGPEKNRIMYTAKDLGIDNKIHILGQLSSVDVRNCLQKADILVHAALSEGIANVVVEAMSCSIPVVTTSCGGMDEAITDGVEGFLVPVRDPQAMAVAIAYLAALPELRVEMGKAGRRRVLQQFELEAQGHQFLKLYRSLLKESR